MNVLKDKLNKIDQKGYKAYKDIQGEYAFQTYLLHIDYVQGDPFASPSKVRIVIPRKKTEISHHFTEHLLSQSLL
ncbi:ABC-ATPase domain-containing protein [Alkalihalobacillus sp. MEB130]|uniref:ABC-ATPase domain-containing protein n=1 Tax=Alkalihalobacillus sp. MEB130 TaxID=2976704 RepID=UPI0028DFBC02|nr:ABC-ATPase domain-containing protein [Alkalihalobacillus sp. MEB130]MDT8861325.1 ABC-ATPase domain-containing protein [Alkalihalobacillus sp. MEB130]